MYALFRGKDRIGKPFPTEKEVWQGALIEGLVTDVPVADEAGGQILPVGYHVERVAEVRDSEPESEPPKEKWKPSPQAV